MNNRKLLRNLVFTAICLIIFSHTLWAVQIEDTKPATDYTKVSSNLLKLEKSGVRNADMYNQLGLSYYNQGNNGKAVLYFLRALRLNSNHKDAKNNLDYVTGRSLDREMYAQTSFLSGMFQKGFDFFSLNALAIIALLLLIITVLCIHWLLRLGSDQDKIVPVMWLTIFGFIFLVSATMLGLKYKDFHNSNKAVVIEPMVDGNSGPGTEYSKIFTIHSGLIVHITRIDKDWALITLPNGGAGWIRVSSIEKVKP